MIKDECCHNLLVKYIGTTQLKYSTSCNQPPDHFDIIVQNWVFHHHIYQNTTHWLQFPVIDTEHIKIIEIKVCT